MARSKTYVNSVTERLLDSENFKSSSDFGMYAYQYDQRSRLRPRVSDPSLSEFIVDAQKTSMPNKFRAAYRFASNKERYVFGLPQSQISLDATEDIKQSLGTYLTKIEKSPVTILYNKLNRKNLYHFVWLELRDKLLYSGLTNELKVLSIQKGTPCYLFGGHLELSQRTYDDSLLDGNLEQSGLSLSYGEAFDREENINRGQPEAVIGAKDKLVVMFAYKEDDVVLYEAIELDLSHINPVIDDITPNEFEWLQATYKVGNEYKQFTYEYLSGGISEIDKSVAYTDSMGQYYPRIYTRLNAKNIIDLPETNKKRKDTEKILKRLGLDLETLTDQLGEAIEDMDHNFKFIFMQLTVSINKEMDDLVTGKYLFNYFNRLHDKGSVIDSSTKSGLSQQIVDTDYTQEVKYWKSSKVLKDGVAKNNKGVNLKVGEHCVKYSSNHILIQQISSTKYIELTVFNLEMAHKFSGQVVRTSGKDEGLTIPLDYSVVRNMVSKERELLVNKALQITVTTLQVVKKKWYQRGAFKVLMAVVSIAINVIVPGSGLTLWALVQAVAYTALLGLAINVAMTVAISIGTALGISSEVLAVVTFVAVFGYAFATGKVDYSKLLDAKAAMKALMPSLEMYQKSIANNIKIVRKEMEEFQQYAKDEWERLQVAQDMLITGVIPPSLAMLTAPLNSTYLYLGETAEDFYTRSTTTDVTDLSTNMVDYFLDITTNVPNTVTSYERPFINIHDELIIN